MNDWFGNSCSLFTQTFFTIASWWTYLLWAHCDNSSNFTFVLFFRLFHWRFRMRTVVLALDILFRTSIVIDRSWFWFGKCATRPRTMSIALHLLSPQAENGIWNAGGHSHIPKRNAKRAFQIKNCWWQQLFLHNFSTITLGTLTVSSVLLLSSVCFSKSNGRSCQTASIFNVHFSPVYPRLLLKSSKWVWYSATVHPR